MSDAVTPPPGVDAAPQAATPAHGLFIPDSVLALGVTWSARLVLAEVLNLHKCKGRVFARDSYFVERLKLSKRIVGQAIKELEDAGMLARDTNQARREKRILTPLCRVDAQPIAESATATPLLQILPQPLADSATDLLQILPQPLADSADINKNSKERGNKSQIKSAILSEKVMASAAKAGESTATTKPAFEDFWTAYDKKVDRHKCQLRWDSLEFDAQVNALAAVPAYVTNTPEKFFRKNPLTWLNGKCWLDEETPEVAPLFHRPTAGARPHQTLIQAAYSLSTKIAENNIIKI